MPDSSILGGDKPQPRAAGRDTDALGPSDSSDSGSDIQGETPMATGADQPDELGAIPVDPESDSDRTGTGERGSATGDAVVGADILPDRIASDPTFADHDRRDDSPELDAREEAEDLAASDANGLQNDGLDDDVAAEADDEGQPQPRSPQRSP